MLIKLSQELLFTLERANTLHMDCLQEVDAFKAENLKEDYGRERALLVRLLNKAVEASKLANH